MHSCPGYWMVIGYAVVYHARAAQAFSAEFNVGTVVMIGFMVGKCYKKRSSKFQPLWTISYPY